MAASLVEQKYNEALDAMGGRGRVERTISLFGAMCELLSFKISKEFPNISERELRRKVAERLYLSDNETQRLLKKVRAA